MLYIPDEPNGWKLTKVDEAAAGPVEVPVPPGVYYIQNVSEVTVVETVVDDLTFPIGLV
jgi:hypothetical protein